eukprot:TRINITY_DN6998_c0_g1_i1.p1 TRINITY_DN6998_c0_g1~~TRINITY_DN6998_c0_g1_i1.p1  ORF type:complete len:528 (+),score=74.48 TRINITY_DN6998_c0_g1_i1:4491-6074(+)
MSSKVNFGAVLSFVSEKAEHLQSAILTAGLGVTGVAMASDALYYAVMRAVQRRAMCETMFNQTISWSKVPHFSEEREAMMRYLMKKFTQLSTYSLLCVNKGSGNTTILRKLATECKGVMYISLLNATTLEDVINILRTELNIRESAKMGTINLMLHKFLKLSEVIEEEAEHEWDEVTSVYEEVALDVKRRLKCLKKGGKGARGAYCSENCCQDDAAVLILDHIDGLENDAAAAIQRWAAACQVKALMHIVIVSSVGFRFFGTNPSTSQEIVVLAGASIKEGLAYAKLRLPSMQEEFIKKLVSRTGPKLGDINAACRFLNEDVNFITSEVICPNFTHEKDRQVSCLPTEPILALTDGVILDEELVFLRLEAFILFRFQTDFRNWHVYGYHSMADEELDLQRFYIFMIVLRLEKKIDEDILDGRIPPACPFANFKVFIDFECLFSFVPMHVFVSLLSQRSGVPLRCQFNEVGFLSPSDYKCFKWVIGEPGSERRTKVLSSLPALLPEGERHILEQNKIIQELLQTTTEN